MRSYLTSLIFEKLLDNISTADRDVYNLAQIVLTPTVKVIESVCNTVVGDLETLGYQIEGEIELATNTRISRNRIDQLLSQGIYTVASTHLRTCTSKGGVCARCYSADFPSMPLPNVGGQVVIPSEKVLHIEVLEGVTGITEYPLTTSSTYFGTAYVYYAGALKSPSEYVMHGESITLLFPILQGEHVIIKFADITTTPYMGYLSNTYSGSLLGMKPLPTPPILLKHSLLNSMIPENRLELISSRVKTLEIPDDQKDYIDKITTPLEKLLYVVALYVIYSNVQ